MSGFMVFTGVFSYFYVVFEILLNLVCIWKIAISWGWFAVKRKGVNVGMRGVGMRHVLQNFNMCSEKDMGGVPKTIN